MKDILTLIQKQSLNSHYGMFNAKLKGDILMNAYAMERKTCIHLWRVMSTHKENYAYGLCRLIVSGNDACYKGNCILNDVLMGEGE